MSIIDYFLDKTIVFSYDRSGFLRHEKRFEPENLEQVPKKNILITGGNAGIGFSLAKNLSKNHNLHLLCRNSVKAARAKETILDEEKDANVKLHMVDLGELEQVRRFCNELEEAPFDVVVLNAGSMPREKKVTSEGRELIFASQVLGHFTLIMKLIEEKKVAAGCRFIFVSSAGMYLQKLDLSDIDYQLREYSGLRAYANAKKAQVALTTTLAKHFKDAYFFSAMHPGWVDTQGVERDIPYFYKVMKKRLRTPEMGQDTIYWLALTEKKLPNGSFFFDRKEAQKELFSFYQHQEKDEKDLFDLCLTASE